MERDLKTLKPYQGMKLAQAKVSFCANMVELALQLAEGHHQHAADLLGIHRNTLLRIMRESGRPLSTRGGWNRGMMRMRAEPGEAHD
jgi:DNA-binding NtrC family response regulator